MRERATVGAKVQSVNAYGYVFDLRGEPLHNVVVSVLHCHKWDIPKKGGFVPQKYQHNLGSIRTNVDGSYSIVLRPAFNTVGSYNLWVEVRSIITNEILFRSEVRPRCEGPQCFMVTLPSEATPDFLPKGTSWQLRELPPTRRPCRGSDSEIQEKPNNDQE